MFDDFRGDEMTMEFAFDDSEFATPSADDRLDRRRAHALEVMADLDGATEDAIDALPQELPVEAVVACGNCRLYAGISAQSVFPVWLAVVAAKRLVGLLEQAASDAENLPKLWEDCTSDEAEDLVAGLLHARTDAWAATIQLDEVLENSPDETELEAAIERVDAALDRFDRALFTRQDELSTLASTLLLANFRSMIAPEYSDPLPWWLDGRLETRAEDIEVAIDDLIADTLFGLAPARVLPFTPTLSGLRSIVTQTYAAAAAGMQGAGGVPRARWRWRSPDGLVFAELVPPAVMQPVPERIVFDFTDGSAAASLGVVGRVCRLAGVQAVIQRCQIDGEDRAVAFFSGDAVLGASATTGEEPLGLFVEPNDEAWVFDSQR